MEQKQTKKQQLSILIANTLIHFDNALYGYLVPIMIPYLYPHKNLAVQLIWGYSPFIVSFVAKPFGLLFFSKMAQNKKETKALRYTLLGVSMSLMVIGCLPTYQEASLWNMILLLMARTCAESCAAGEQNIAKIYLLKDLPVQEAKKQAALYQVSTMLGILCAGLVGAFFASIHFSMLYWRLLFLIAALATLLNILVFRLKPAEISENNQLFEQKESPYLAFWSERKAMIRIAIVAGFSYVTYTIPFLFINSFVPMVTTITYTTMMQYLPIFMVFDLVLIGWIAKLGQKTDHNNLMAVASGLVCLSIIPLFAGLPGASIFYVTGLRCWLIFLGVVFSAFLTIWSKEQIATARPYMTIGFASMLGSSLFGKSSVAICFYLFHTYNTPIAPACYIALLAFSATLIMADSASA